MPGTSSTPDRMTVDGLFVWDPWPVQHPDGSVATIGDRELWVALAAPADGHPEDRHDHARQHLLSVGAAGTDPVTDAVTDAVTNLGPLFPDGASLGSREWSGTTVYDPHRATITAYYTASGTRGETAVTYTQRIMAAEGLVTFTDAAVTIDWGPHRELVRPDGCFLPSGFAAGSSWLAAFRDPAWFRDPSDGAEYLLLAASVGGSDDPGPWGAIGVARLRDGRGSGRWEMLPDPILQSVGSNRELERPHVIVRDGRYYLFVSTQTHTSTLDPAQPTGLYCYVADRLQGPYLPVDGDGLVLANPDDRPHLAYAWWVLEDLRVASFLNYPDEAAGGSRPRPDGRFVGGFGPWHLLELSNGRFRVRPYEHAGAM